MEGGLKRWEIGDVASRIGVGCGVAHLACPASRSPSRLDTRLVSGQCVTHFVRCLLSGLFYQERVYLDTVKHTACKTPCRLHKVY